MSRVFNHDISNERWKEVVSKIWIRAELEAVSSSSVQKALKHLPARSTCFHSFNMFFFLIIDYGDYSPLIMLNVMKVRFLYLMHDANLIWTS